MDPEPKPTDWSVWEARFAQFLHDPGGGDAAHDLDHIRRVVANARRLAQLENAITAVVIPAAWLHDCVHVPKHSEQRPHASRLAATRAERYLRDSGYPEIWLSHIRHAIEAHSYSAGIQPRSLEAAVVQDADRLDALGAVGIARTLMLGGSYGQRLYDPQEPLPEGRDPNDSLNIIDHFYVKLLHLANSMKTVAGRDEAQVRTRFMQAYLAQLAREIAGDMTATGATGDFID